MRTVLHLIPFWEQNLSSSLGKEKDKETSKIFEQHIESPKFGLQKFVLEVPENGS